MPSELAFVLGIVVGALAVGIGAILARAIWAFIKSGEDR